MRLEFDMKILSDDQMEGRGVGTPGIDKAAEYIAAVWKGLGLESDLWGGTPYQKFSLSGPMGIQDPDRNYLELIGPKGQKFSMTLSEDFTPVSLGNNGEFEAPVVFVGYGITANEADLQYDDYAGLDCRGKVVVMFRKEPRQNDPNSPFAGIRPSEYSFFANKESNAVNHEAIGLLLLNDLASGDQLLPVDGAGRAFSNDQIPTMFVRRSAMQPILAEALGTSLEEIEKGIDTDLVPRSRELEGWKAVGQCSLRQKLLPAQNVAAVLPGEGDLAREYVVVGAHYDHVGMGGPGSMAPGTIEVHNGADDNASGTVALIETSRRLVESLQGPRRTVIFLAFSGEERGLLGSNYYVRNPRFALENTVAMVNMDMVGRLKNNQLTVYGTGSAVEFDGLIDRLNERYQFELEKVPAGLGPSDHASFFEAKIPVFHFFTGLHNDYHRPSDDFDKINVTGMVRITDMVTELVNHLATVPSRPEFVQVKGRANPRVQRDRQWILGVRFRPSDSGPWIIDAVVENSLAARAGLQPEDQVVELDGKQLETTAAIPEALRHRKVGDAVELTIRRSGETLKLEVRLQN
jgi:hypothetical protein